MNIPSVLSSITSDDLKKKEIASLFENITSNSPDLQQIIRNCGSGTNLSQMFAYAAVASMAQQFAATTSQQLVDSSNSSLGLPIKKVPKKLPLKSNELKVDKSKVSPKVNSISPLVNKILGVIKQEPKQATEAEVENNASFSTTSTTAISDFWSNMTTIKTTPSGLNTTGAESEFKKDANSDNVLESETGNDSLPKESDLSERKRPAAIQELLQMKKARLSHSFLSTSLDRQVNFLKFVDIDQIKIS